TADSEPPGWPLPAVASIRTMWRRRLVARSLSAWISSSVLITRGAGLAIRVLDWGSEFGVGRQSTGAGWRWQKAGAPGDPPAPLNCGCGWGRPFRPTPFPFELR